MLVGFEGGGGGLLKQYDFKGRGGGGQKKKYWVQRGGGHPKIPSNFAVTALKCKKVKKHQIKRFIRKK